MTLFENRYQILGGTRCGVFCNPPVLLGAQQIEISKLYKPFHHRGWRPDAHRYSEIEKFKNSKKSKNDPKSTPPTSHMMNPCMNLGNLHNHPLEL